MQQLMYSIVFIQNDMTDLNFKPKCKFTSRYLQWYYKNMVNDITLKIQDIDHLNETFTC